MRILSGADIAALVDSAALIAPLEAAMRSVSRRQAELPLRSVTPVGGRNRLGVMPGSLASPAGYGAKLLSLFPDNPAQGRSSHSGVMLIFDVATGLPAACLNAAVLTALRTAAATALATRALARPDAATLALIGCGEQAEAHLHAMRAVRPIGRAIVWGRDPARAAAFARHHGIEAEADIARAVAAADIVCTVTPAMAPLIRPAMLHPGLHINAVGASMPPMQEIAPACLPHLRLFTDYLPSLEAQASEVIAARGDGLIGADHPITEIGAVLDGAPGRADSAEVTMYRSLGIAAQDIAAASFILARAERDGRGVVVAID